MVMEFRPRAKPLPNPRRDGGRLRPPSARGLKHNRAKAGQPQGFPTQWVRFKEGRSSRERLSSASSTSSLKRPGTPRSNRSGFLNRASRVGVVTPRVRSHILNASHPTHIGHPEMRCRFPAGSGFSESLANSGRCSSFGPGLSGHMIRFAALRACDGSTRRQRKKSPLAAELMYNPAGRPEAFPIRAIGSPRLEGGSGRPHLTRCQ